MEALPYLLIRFGIKMPIVITKFSRWSIPELYYNAGYKVGAEIGVGRGGFSARCCKLIPNLKMFSIDPYECYTGEHEEYNSPEFMKWMYKSARHMLSKYNCEIIVKKSMDAVKDFEDGSLDFVYIDADHSFDCVQQDIVEWSKKVRPGGIVSGHDYNEIEGFGVIDAVQKYTRDNKIAPWFVVGWKIDSLSWMWVKP